MDSTAPSVGGSRSLLECHAVAIGPVSASPFAHHAGNYKIWIIECRPERVAERITQLAALMDRTRTLRRCVARNSSRKRKLKKELLEARFILTDIRINLAVSAFEVGVAYHRGPPCPEPET